MNNWIYLSYPIDSQTPAYGGGDGIVINKDKELLKGDSCNTSTWSFSNHIGTHIDLPKHFSRNGRTLTDYPVDFWIYNTLAVIDISPVNAGSVIEPTDIDFSSVDSKIELLFIKTGFCDFRSDEIYWQQNPGFSPKLPQTLKETFPYLRVLGLDSISVSSFMHRDIGRQTHRAFLNDPNPILLLEDADLRYVGCKTKFKKIIIAPLCVTGADGSPCTVFGEIL